MMCMIYKDNSDGTINAISADFYFCKQRIEERNGNEWPGEDIEPLGLREYPLPNHGTTPVILSKEGKPMKQQPKDHKITVRLNIDGEEYAKGIILSPEQVVGPEGIKPEGIKQQRKLVEYLVKAMELTIKTELGKQGEPAFELYAPEDGEAE